MKKYDYTAEKTSLHSFNRKPIGLREMDIKSLLALRAANDWTV